MDKTNLELRYFTVLDTWLAFMYMETWIPYNNFLLFPFMADVGNFSALGSFVTINEYIFK